MDISQIIATIVIFTVIFYSIYKMSKTGKGLENLK